MVSPDLRRRISNLLIRGVEIHAVVVWGPSPSDLTDPPAIVVESIDNLVRGELAARVNFGRRRAKVPRVQGFDEGLRNVVVLEEGLVLDDVVARVEVAENGGFVVGAKKAFFPAAHFDLVAFAEIDPLQWWTHRFG